MVPAEGLKQLLSSAQSLIRGGDDLPKQSVTIEGMQFSMLAQHENGHGWIVILIQDSHIDYCDSALLKKRYKLTARETEVAYLLAQRLSNREIAERLGVKVCTAGRHTERVMSKLGVCSRKDVQRCVSIQHYRQS